MPMSLERRAQVWHQDLLPTVPSRTADQPQRQRRGAAHSRFSHRLSHVPGNAPGAHRGGDPPNRKRVWRRSRAKESGFDGIEIHAAHGYLISEFLSPYTNKRVDEYGGCFDNRARFLDEVYTAVRQAVGKDFPVIVRISVNEYLLGGRTEAESFVLARHCEELGFDAVHISNGMYASPALR